MKKIRPVAGTGFTEYLALPIFVPGGVLFNNKLNITATGPSGSASIYPVWSDWPEN